MKSDQQYSSNSLLTCGVSPKRSKFKQKIMKGFFPKATTINCWSKFTYLQGHYSSLENLLDQEPDRIQIGGIVRYGSTGSISSLASDRVSLSEQFYFSLTYFPGLFFVSFHSFQSMITILQQINVNSIRCRDSNSQPSEFESPPLTTRQGLPSFSLTS